MLIGSAVPVIYSVEWNFNFVIEYMDGSLRMCAGIMEHEQRAIVST